MSKISQDELRYKWDVSWQAHQYEIDKYTLVDKWMRAYEKHLRVGEDWNDSFRFPELHGYVLRKYDNLIEFWPEMKIKGEGNEVTKLQAAYDHQVRISNLQREKNRVGMDAVKGGFGCLFVAPVRYERMTQGGKKLFYDGLGAERVDPRDIIPAYSALQMHDHTGQQYCPYVFRRKVYYKDTFNNKYGNDPKFKIPEGLAGTTYEGGFTGDRTLTDREGIEKESGDYITVLEYWDQENDIMRVYANSFNNMIYESPNGIPYSHKQVPFHFYYDYRRHDSIYGVGEIELNMGYNLFRESVLNLMIDDMRLSLQPAYVVAGDVNFNTEEQELEPGAVFTLRGQNVGKVADSIMPFRAGGIQGDSFQALQTIENSRITVTGDDTTALYANPNQLATQTLAKREALQKRNRSLLLRNAIETEFYLANQIVSYLQNELSKPYKDEKGKTQFRKIKAPGYFAIQDKKESDVELKQVYGKEAEFYLNKTVSEKFGEQEIEIVTPKLDEEIKRDKMEKLMMFTQQIFQAASVNPQVIEDLSMGEFLKDVSQQLSLDVKKIFPPADKEGVELDVINAEHDQIAMGMVPEILPDEDSMAHYMKHIEFEKSSIFKKLGKKAKDSMRKHKLLTLQNVQVQKAKPPQPESKRVAGPPQAGQQPPVQGVVRPPQGQAAPGGAGVPTQAAPGGLREGAGEREATPAA